MLWLKVASGEGLHSVSFLLAGGCLQASHFARTEA